MVNHHPGVFHMKDLHDILLTVDEDEDFSAANISAHLRVNNTTQGVKALAHIYRMWVEIIRQILMKMEHPD
jgi:hypothetical protein